MNERLFKAASNGTVITITEQKVGKLEIVGRTNVNTIDMRNDRTTGRELRHESPQIVVERTLVRL